jgi:hypothetical protein
VFIVILFILVKLQYFSMSVTADVIDVTIAIAVHC